MNQACGKEIQRHDQLPLRPFQEGQSRRMASEYVKDLCFKLARGGGTKYLALEAFPATADEWMEMDSCIVVDDERLELLLTIAELNGISSYFP